MSALLEGDDTAGPRAAIAKLVEDLASRGIRSLAVARAGPGAGAPWKAVGLLTFLDPPRPDTKDTLHRAQLYGVKIKMARSFELGYHARVPGAARGRPEKSERRPTAHGRPTPPPPPGVG